MDRYNEDRYVLTDKGIRFLAERAGVSPAMLRTAGGVRPTKRWAGDRQHGVRHVEHTIGMNRFLARLATDARAAGGRLVEARNDAESAYGFTDTRGRKSAVRPDASGIVEVGSVRLPFILEYDRGTLDGGDYRGKFEGYRRYYEVGAWNGQFDREPVLLFVCSDDQAERRVMRAAGAASVLVPLFATTEWRLARGDRGGALGSVWAQTSARSGTRLPTSRGPFFTPEPDSPPDARRGGEEEPACP